MKLSFGFLLIYFSTAVFSTKYRSVLTIDENSVCHIKRSCLDCLRLSQCSWCSNENKCYSMKLVNTQGYCENATIHHTDYGMSIEENAECSCAGGNLERNCVPPGAAQEEECSGRGKCICGRCFCKPNPDSENPSKAILGEYCEYDNFSCDGPRCSEGPYNINDQKTMDDEDNTETDIAQPSEE